MRRERRYGLAGVEFVGRVYRMSIATLVLIAMALATAGGARASSLEMRPLALPEEIAGLNLSEVHADRGQFIVNGQARDGACVVALLSQQLSLLAIRRFPGSYPDYCRFASFDSAGDILLTGLSLSSEFPFTFDLGPKQPSVVFILKLSRTTLDVKFAIRVGLGALLSLAIAKDDSIWIGGFATDRLATTPDAIQPDYPGYTFIISPRDRAGFVARLSADGRRILYCTYLGGLRDAVGAVSIDSLGNVYAAGSQIWKFSSTGRLIWSTWLPPSSTWRSAIGPNGDLYLVGSIGLNYLFYTSPQAFQPTAYSNQFFRQAGASIAYPAASVDGFVARLSPDGEVIYSTLMGGIGSDYLDDITVRDDGSAMVSGYSSGRLFPTRAPMAVLREGTVLASLSADGTSAGFSTYTLQATTHPAFFEDGTMLLLSYCDSSALRVCAFRGTESPDFLPRIDALVDSLRVRDPLAPGANATISGEGFSMVTAVTVGELPARIVSQSDCLLEIEIPPNLPGVTPQTNFTGDVRLLRDGEVLRQVRIQVFPAR